ncbi:tetratricopeptide repeat protein [Anabaenopsis tanganyikae CS-531]|uniref:Tetratricopeptide repeat protein n=1 Tax=Anabaenopsis tanganyikae CS-531 TaxID=2785304 RepID=A0ABT6KCQ7_9CYAN|nr:MULTISPECIES: tetratricopeptide repeat protein [Anabaenopsis]MDH6099517.1 tetratricopeptide repeat protein [Anabaenopsis sp. FSS-46]MDH6105533.1 tetratricopeptide repeat protein [Anabaenopsis tanganyikae CS-531]
MELIGLPKAIALTTLTFTLSATPTWGQTNQNQALTIKNSQVVSQRPPILYSQSQSNRDLAETYLMRGIDYYDQGKWELALVDYNQAIKLNPNLALAYIGRGAVYLELGHINKARENFQRAAQLYREQGNRVEYQLTIKVLNSL